MVWGPRLHPLALASVAAAALAIVAGAASGRRATDRPASFAARVLALALVLGLALNVARAGHPRLGRDLRPAARRLVRGRQRVPARAAGALLRHALLPRPLRRARPVAAGQRRRPPAGAAARAACLRPHDRRRAPPRCASASPRSTAPLTYALGRALGSDRDARVAAVLFACSPRDAALRRDVVRRRLRHLRPGRRRAARGASGAPCGRPARWRSAPRASCSWALLAVGAWATVLAWRRRGALAAVGLAAACAAAWLALNGALAAAYGYDPIGTLRATEHVYRHSVATVRPYAFWVARLAGGVGRHARPADRRRRRCARGRARDDAAVALAVVVVVAAVGGFTKAETERIWLFLVPLACVAAAPAIIPRRSPPVTARARGPGARGRGALRHHLVNGAACARA